MADKLIYAVVVTFVILAAITLSKAAERAKKLEEERNKGLLGLGRSNEE